MAPKILNKFPTLLRHKLKSKMAHFAVLYSVYVFKTTQNQYRISFDAFAYFLLSVLLLIIIEYKSMASILLTSPYSIHLC